jgi:hypothetical protein
MKEVAWGRYLFYYILLVRVGVRKERGEIKKKDMPPQHSPHPPHIPLLHLPKTILPHLPRALLITPARMIRTDIDEGVRFIPLA